jgi:hypothetical protein
LIGKMSERDEDTIRALRAQVAEITRERDEALAAGRAAERADVVAWLRRRLLVDAPDCIERGEHVREDKP